MIKKPLSKLGRIFKPLRITKIRGIPFEITLGWMIVAVAFTASLREIEAYERYLKFVEFLPVVSATPAFPQHEVALILFSGTLVCGVYFSVLLHELGHALAAQHQGLEVNSIRLWIAGGVAKFEDIPPQPRIEFITTICGPAVTLALIPIFYGVSLVFTHLGMPIISWYFTALSFFNGGMLLLNLTPAFPLDGGRLLRSSLTTQTPYLRSTNIATYVTYGIAVAAAIAFYQGGNIAQAWLAGLVCVLARGERRQIKAMYDNNLITNADQLRIYERSFAFAPFFPENVEENLTPYIEEAGGAVTDIADAELIIGEERVHSDLLLTRETNLRAEDIEDCGAVTLQSLTGRLSQLGYPTERFLDQVTLEEPAGDDAPSNNALSTGD